MRIRFSPESIKDLQRLHDFLAHHDPETAHTVVLNLKSAISRLATLPNRGRPVEKLPNVREFVFGGYVIRYLVRDEAVYVLRLWHGREAR